MPISSALIIHRDPFTVIVVILDMSYASSLLHLLSSPSTLSFAATPSPPTTWTQPFSFSPQPSTVSSSPPIASPSSPSSSPPLVLQPSLRPPILHFCCQVQEYSFVNLYQCIHSSILCLWGYLQCLMSVHRNARIDRCDLLEHANEWVIVGFTNK